MVRTPKKHLNEQILHLEANKKAMNLEIPDMIAGDVCGHKIRK